MKGGENVAKYAILNSISNGTYQDCVDANGYVELYVNNTKYTKYTGAYSGIGTVYGIRISPSLAAIIGSTVSGRDYRYYVLIIASRQYNVQPYAYYNDEVAGIGGGGAETIQIRIGDYTYNGGSIAATYRANETTVIRDSTGILSTLTDTVNTESELDDLLTVLDIKPVVDTYPITYRPNNCSFPGAPTEAAVGDTVVVPVTFPNGYGLVNESNIYVTNNGIVIPSTYSNGHLTFTMPDPS